MSNISGQDTPSQEPSYKQDVQGFCQKCRMALISIGGSPQCPNCTSRNPRKKKIVVFPVDPGANNWEDPDNMDKKKELPINTPVKEKDLVTVSITLGQLTDLLGTKGLEVFLLKCINGSLDDLPFTTMGEAKKVMKVQEAIELLIKEK